MGTITFLGTGGDSALLANQQRSFGGIILTHLSEQLHIDPGPGSLIMAKACNFNVREMTAILVSHNHVKHAGDLNAVIDAMTVGGLDKSGILYAAQSVIEATEGMRPIISHFHKDSLEKAIVMEPRQTEHHGDIQIDSLPAYHPDEHSIGFRIITHEFTMAYSGDTGFDPELWRNYRCDVVILNVQQPGNRISRGHLCSEEASEILKNAKPKLAIITHFGQKMLVANPNDEARIIQQKSGVRTIAAVDGMVINTANLAVGRPI